MKQIIQFLSCLKMTLAGAVFLAASLILILTDIKIPVDPAWVTVTICGIPLMYYAITALVFDRKISSALLITLAMIASIFIGELFAAGEVAFIMALGALLEEKTAERARKGIKHLISLVPVMGRRIVEGQENMIPAEGIKIGDVLRVLPGEAIPVDGEILTGNTSVDQSIMTGESLPADKTAGDSVFCGTINQFGSIDIKAVKVGDDSSLQKLIRMVQEAENNKAPMQRIADKWASWLVPTALVLAIVVYFVTSDIIRAVTILVVFCPCALALATPTSIMAAIGQAAKNGVIIKSGDALERMGKVDTIVFDKTGTLTHGNLVVSDILSSDTSLPETDILKIAASVETFSEHPLGKAIAACAKEKGFILQPVKNFKMIPGKGISAEMENQEILCGNSAWLKERKVAFDNQTMMALDKFRAQGKAVIIIARSSVCIGTIALSDTLRSAAKNMIAELEHTRTNTVLLTGDHTQTANYLAQQLGIKSVFAELLPSEKVEHIQKMQQEGYRICMVGDGVNDAPALKTANVGIAMASIGSDIAIEAADIALMGDGIEKIPYLKRLSNATIRLIKINISLSMAINFAAIILSMLALLNPITGALVHNGGSILVILNAALLYERRF